MPVPAGIDRQYPGNGSTSFCDNNPSRIEFFEDIETLRFEFCRCDHFFSQHSGEYRI